MTSLLLKLGLTTLLVGAVAAHGQAPQAPLPNGTVRLIVPYAAGGPIDMVARLVAEKLPARIGRSVVVENRPGAAGNVAARYVAGVAPDGMTLMATGDSVFTVNPSLYTKQSFDPEQDFTPVSFVGTYPMVVAASTRSGVHSLRELVARSQQAPLNFGSGGNGSPGHLGFEYLRMVSGVRGVHVPYAGGAPAANALLAGEVDAAVLSVSATESLARSGKIVPLAVTAAARDATLPSVPTSAEAGFPNYSISFSYLFMAPSRVPPPVLQYLNREINAVLAADDVGKRLQAVGIDRKLTSVAEARDWLSTERNRWEKVIKASGMKID